MYECYMDNLYLTFSDICRVTKVTEKEVEVLDKKTGKTTVYPTGLVVWSTGIAPVPLTKTICESLPEQCNK